MASDEENARVALKIIADAIPIHLLHLDLEERILFANEAAASMWGRRAEEMVGRSIAEVIGVEGQQALRSHTARVLAGERVSYEASFVTPEGSTRHFLNTYEPILGPDGRITGFVATGTDITDRKVAEDALAASQHSETSARRRLEEERELRERFVTSLAHDVRGPLTAAKVSAQLAGRSAADPERVRRLTARIVDALDRADAMIRDMLDASVIERGHLLTVRRQPVELRAFLGTVVDELASVHGDRFQFSSDHPPVTAAVDPAALHRAVENLLANAVKYGDPVAPIQVRLSHVDGFAHLEVHNQGTPIPPEELPMIFEPFRRAHTAQRSGQKGWGLGLTLVKGIVDAHGGRVSVSSAEGHGTTFGISLPLDGARAA